MRDCGKIVNKENEMKYMWIYCGENWMIIVKYWLLMLEKRGRSYIEVDWSLDLKGYCCEYCEKILMWFK